MRSGSPARRKRRSYSASALGVERRLLVGRGEGVGRARAALLAEDERHLARWAQPLRGIRAEGRAGLVEAQRAQQVAPEEAIVARDLLTLRHASNILRVVSEAGIEPDPRAGVNPRSRKSGTFR